MREMSSSGLRGGVATLAWAFAILRGGISLVKYEIVSEKGSMRRYAFVDLWRDYWF
jgi:hypothetical protein